MKTTQLILSLVLATATLTVTGAAMAQASELSLSTETVTVKIDELEVKIRTTATGRSLYIFDNDVGGDSTCYNGCARTWPPVLVTAAEAQSLGTGLSTTTRRDGTLQLTIDAKPVYKFISDAKPGDILGEGLGGVWHLIPVD
jgi:predicted lipoprotein with Yx(FWY)xxD motif